MLKFNMGSVSLWNSFATNLLLSISNSTVPVNILFYNGQTAFQNHTFSFMVTYALPRIFDYIKSKNPIFYMVVAQVGIEPTTSRL